MATLVHLTPEKNASRILRRGIVAGRGIFCMPVLPHYYIAHQWVRELKRQGQRCIVAIYFQVPSDEVVLVGHFGEAHQLLKVGEAIRAILEAPNALGYELILQRAVAAEDIVRLRRPSQVLGWRYSPSPIAFVSEPHSCAFCETNSPRTSMRITPSIFRPLPSAPHPQ